MSDLLTRLRTAASYRMDGTLASRINEAAVLLRQQGDLLNEAAAEIERLSERPDANVKVTEILERLKKLEEFVNGCYDL